MMKRKAKSAREIVDELLAKALSKDACLLCHLAPNKRGYSPVQVGGRTGDKWRAHRLVYHILCEEVPPDKMVLHTCDNRRCINTEHLYIGTAADNTADMMTKGRGKNQYGYVRSKLYPNRTESFYTGDE